MSADKPCGAGHFCCDVPEGPPLHDHFLSPADCVSCARAPAHPVQGEARATDAERQAEIRARSAAFNAWYTRSMHQPGGIPTVTAYSAGWDAHTAHAAAEVEQLKTEIIEIGKLLLIDDGSAGMTAFYDVWRRLTEHGAEPR